MAKKKDKSDKKSDAKRKGKKSDSKRDVKSKVKTKNKGKGKGKKDDRQKNKAKGGGKKAGPGASVKDREMYETLRSEGNSKKKSARIANASAGSSREAVGQQGGSAPAYDEWTKAALYARAKDVDLPGRSTMNKQELVDALRDS